jgi:hypothetical protein
MAEHDNSGLPLSYCVLSTASSIENGKRTKALTAWAKCLRDMYGVAPVFAHVDKDMAEIGMLRDVWRPKIELCWWHMSGAVEDRLKKNKLSTTPYNVSRAQSEFPFISTSFVPCGKPDPKEHEGGTGGTRDHTGVTDNLQYESLNAVTLRIPIPLSLREPLTSNLPSSSAIHNETVLVPPPEPVLALHSTATTSSEGEKLTIKLPARNGKENRGPGTMESESVAHEDVDTMRTFCSVEHRQPIINMIERHYCAHPLIPGYSSPTPAGIREWAVKQIYSYCIEHDLREVWAYLWENWYRPGRWDLWARCGHPEIPILKTTMILEAQ